MLCKKSRFEVEDQKINFQCFLLVKGPNDRLILDFSV